MTETAQLTGAEIEEYYKYILLCESMQNSILVLENTLESK